MMLFISAKELQQTFFEFISELLNNFVAHENFFLQFLLCSNLRFRSGQRQLLVCIVPFFMVKSLSLK
jgi:hypothetical protein